MSRYASLAELPAQHRRQVEDKLAELPRASVHNVTSGQRGRPPIDPAKRKNKYNAVRNFADGHWFASKKEMRCYLIAKAREAKDEITDVRVHVKFSLFDAGGHCRGEHIGTYTCDLTWREGGKLIVADAKSEKTRTLRDWPRTKALMRACHSVEVREL